MKDQAKTSHLPTIRLPQALGTEPDNTACDPGLSKSDFIRRSVPRALVHAKKHELPLLADAMLTEVAITLPNETLEQIDAGIERFYPAITDRRKFVELAVDWALSNLREESPILIRQKD